MIHTHYDNLRIKRNATPGIIKAAYRALSIEYHPDRNSNRDTTRIMQIINDAYAVLGDPIARAEYDAKVAAEEAAAASEAAHRQKIAGAVHRVSEAPSVEQVERTPRPNRTQRNRARPTKGVSLLLWGLLATFIIVIIAIVELS